MNLLERDYSTLTFDQWNLVSNLSHCYDEYSGLNIGENFIREQSFLPYSKQFQILSISKLIQSILYQSQLLYRNNQDFLSLSADDRLVLLDSTFKHVTSISLNFIFYKIHLLNHLAYHKFLEETTHSNVLPTARCIANRINFDMIIMKLFLAILSFSTINSTVYSNIPKDNLSNIKQILDIQNIYVEIT